MTVADRGKRGMLEVRRNGGGEPVWRDAPAVTWRGRARAAFSAVGRLFATRSGRGVLLSVLSVAVGACAFRIMCDNFMYRGIDFDESHFVWGGWCINKGLVPYRDFLEFKPPMLFLTHALALKIYGYDHLRYRWLFMWFPMASLVALQVALLSRRIGRLAALALVLGIIHLWVDRRYHDAGLSDSESIGLTYFLLGVACLIARSRRPAWLRSAGGALLLASALSKEPFLPIAGLTWVGCFLLDRREGTVRADALEYLRHTALGAGTLAFALGLYLVPTGALASYLRTMLAYSKLHHDPARSYCVALGRFHPTTPLRDLLKQLAQAQREFLNLGQLGYLLPFVAALLIFVRRQTALLLVAAVAVFAVALYSVTVGNCQWLHYYNLAMAGLFFALVLALETTRRRLRTSWLWIPVGVACLAGVVWPLGPRLRDEWKSVGKRQPGDAYREPVRGVLAIIAQRTTPTDRIFTTGMPALYVQSDRISAVRESAITDEALGMYPGDSDEERLQGLRQQLERHMPKVVVLDPAYGPQRKERHNRVLLMPFLTEHAYTQVAPLIWLRPY